MYSYVVQFVGIMEWDKTNKKERNSGIKRGHIP